MKTFTKRAKSTLMLMIGIIIPCGIQGQKPITPEGAPAIAIKTNLLYDATTTMSIGAEFRLGSKTTLDIPLGYNPCTFSNNKKWKNLLIQPELRWWTCEAFNGHFFGLHVHYALYNVGGLNHPPFSSYMQNHRFEGWLAGTGVSYGYHWILARRWSMEANLGVGYAYMHYDLYPCAKCGDKIGTDRKNYFGPTRAGISLIYMIK